MGLRLKWDGGDLDHRDRVFGVGRFLRIPDINYITEWTKRFQQYFLLMESTSLGLIIQDNKTYQWETMLWMKRRVNHLKALSIENSMDALQIKSWDR